MGKDPWGGGVLVLLLAPPRFQFLLSIHSRAVLQALYYSCPSFLYHVPEGPFFPFLSGAAGHSDVIPVVLVHLRHTDTNVFFKAEHMQTQTRRFGFEFGSAMQVRRKQHGRKTKPTGLACPLDVLTVTLQFRFYIGEAENTPQQKNAGSLGAKKKNKVTIGRIDSAPVSRP